MSIFKQPKDENGKFYTGMKVNKRKLVKTHQNIPAYGKEILEKCNGGWAYKKEGTSSIFCMGDDGREYLLMDAWIE